MTDRNGRQMIEALRATRPDVAITVTREEDPHTAWDGDEPLPEDHTFTCYDHIVTATCIVGGRMVNGASTLGGSWYDLDDADEVQRENVREISGYLPQMIDEAIEEMDKEAARERVNNNGKRG